MATRFDTEVAMSQWLLPVETFDPFRLWLHRPLVDLGPAPGAPSFLVHAIELDYRSMVEQSPRPRIQLSISPSFRVAVATAVGRPEFAVRTCSALPAGLRTERWSTLCDLVESWGGLSPERRVRVCWTLAKLGLYDDILNLVQNVPVETPPARQPEVAAKSAPLSP